MLRDSFIHLWDMAVRIKQSLLVNEDVWREGDDELFEDQLHQLADYMIENDLVENDRTQCGFFRANLGKSLPKDYTCNNCMVWMKSTAVDYQGNFYPCYQFVPINMKKQRTRAIGDFRDGIDTNKLRPFYAFERISQSPEKCLNCEVAGGCIWCAGYNLDYADTDTIYQRSLNLCKMHQAQARLLLLSGQSYRR